MALGDVSLEVNPDGFSGNLIVGDFVLGATYALGTTPGDYKGVLTVTSMGFDAAGAATTVVRTVYIRFVAYLEAPPANAFAPDESVPGADLVTRVIFSEPIYIKDQSAGGSGVDITANIAAGIVVDTGGGATPSNAAVGITVTNNSARAYPKVVARFLTPPFSGANNQAAAVLGSGNFDVDVQAWHRFGVAAVLFTLADGTVTRASTQTAMAWRADLNCPSYRVTDAGSNFTQSANVTCKAVCYPRVGDSGAVQDSSATAFADSYDFATLPLGVCDKGGTYGVTYCAVDAVGGNDGTGVASPVQATAEATPCATIAGAYIKIAAFNLLTYARNTVDAGVVLLIGGGHTYGEGAGTVAAHTGSCCTITRSSATTRANARIVGPNGISRYGPRLTRLYDMSVVPSSGGNQLLGFAHNGSSIVVSDVTATGQSAATKMFDHDNTGKGCHWWKNVTMTAYTTGYSTGNGMVGVLAVNCSTDGSFSAYEGVRCVSGCLSSGAASSRVLQFGGLAWTNNGNIIQSYIRAYGVTGDFVPAGANGNSNDLFIVQCVAERTGGSPAALCEISDAVMKNVVLLQNTLVGDRTNIEGDIVLPLVDKLMEDFVLINNVFTQLAVLSHSDDTAMTLIGNREIQYGVTVRNTHEEDDTLGFAPWPKDYNWTDSSAAGFINDASRTGTDAGNGDYHPDVGSILINRVPAGTSMVPCDLEGITIRNDGTGAIGAYQNALPAVVGGGLLSNRRRRRLMDE